VDEREGIDDHQVSDLVSPRVKWRLHYSTGPDQREQSIETSSLPIALADALSPTHVGRTEISMPRITHPKSTTAQPKKKPSNLLKSCPPHSRFPAPRPTSRLKMASAAARQRSPLGAIEAALPRDRLHVAASPPAAQYGRRGRLPLVRCPR
jgi:hypothetical protein